MNIHPIRTKKDYKNALKEIETLMMAKAKTPDGEKLDILATLVEAYENKHYPIHMPDPIKAIKFEMEQQNLSIEDLVPMIGQKNRVYEDALVKSQDTFI